MEGLVPIPVVVFASVFVLVLWKVWCCLWWKPRSLEKHLRQQGFQGSSYRLLVGDMKEQKEAFMAAWSTTLELTHCIVPRTAPFVHKTVQRYGRRSFIWNGTIPRVIICDQDMAREIMGNKSGYFQKPAVNPLIKLLVMGVISLEGEEWARRRKMINPAFHLAKLKGMFPAFVTSCTNLVERWEKLVHSERSYELDVWPEFRSLTGDVISRAAFGSSYEEGKIFELQIEQTVLAVEASRSVYLPGFRFLPTAKNKRSTFIEKEIKTVLRLMIQRKLASMRRGEVVGDELLSLLLQPIKLNADKKKNSFTIEEVIAECKLFYFAGQESTSSLLTWTLILLSMHPDWQQKAREEVFRICGKRKPDFESISQLKIVNMILHEVLRLYPPFVSFFRHAAKKVKLGDFTLPAGIDVLIPTIMLHHDPEIWGEDAEEFNPERFSEGISKASKGQNAFFPFGWGPRICLGQNFAMLEAKLALAMILQRFSFELSPSYAHAPYIVLTLQPQYGAHITLHQL